MIKNKKIINIVNFPGSGTHFLMDIMAILGFPHNPVLDIIVKIIIYGEKFWKILRIRKKKY